MSEHNIVTRLGTPEDSVRELLSGCTCNFVGDGNCRLCRGAEQIERLRKELEVYKDLYAAELLKGKQ